MQFSESGKCFWRFQKVNLLFLHVIFSANFFEIQNIVMCLRCSPKSISKMEIKVSNLYSIVSILKVTLKNDVFNIINNNLILFVGVQVFC